MSLVTQARRRWRLMLKCVPEPAERGFRSALDFLVATYAPQLAPDGGAPPAPGEAVAPGGAGQGAAEPQGLAGVRRECAAAAEALTGEEVDLSVGTRRVT